MGLKIKIQKNKLRDVKFSDWAKELKEGEERELTLLAFFIPGRYQSFTLSFTDGIYRIRKSFYYGDEEIVNTLRIWYKIIKEAKGKIIFKATKEKDGVILDIKKVINDNYYYEKDDNGSLILKKKTEEEKEKEKVPF